MEEGATFNVAKGSVFVSFLGAILKGVNKKVALTQAFRATFLFERI
jgi:hypothetical protein